MRHAALSPSRASDFKTCPLKFRFRVIDKLPEPPSMAALRGTIVHSVLERLFDFPPAARDDSTAQGLLYSMWERHIEKSPQDAQLFSTESERTQWLESARPLITQYFSLENPSYLEPAGREQFINATLPSGLAIRGIIDRLDRSPTGQLRVIDYKTGKSPAPRYQDGALFQMRFYATALFYSQNVLPARTQLLYLKDGRTLTYDPVPADVDSTTAEIESIWSGIRGAIETGFEPRTGPLCNWCHFKEICPAYGGSAPEISAEGITQLLTAQQPIPGKES